MKVIFKRKMFWASESTLSDNSDAGLVNYFYPIADTNLYSTQSLYIYYHDIISIFDFDDLIEKISKF